MKVYVYKADFLCEDCGEEAIRKLAQEGKTDTGDSDSFPQGPYAAGGGEADAPHHCSNYSNCVNDKGGNGVFLKNPLTSDGVDYVRYAHGERPTDLTRMWMEYYGL